MQVIPVEMFYGDTNHQNGNFQNYNQAFLYNGMKYFLTFPIGF